MTDTNDAGLTVETPSATELTVTFTVAAPQTAVFDAFTNPETALRWMYGPDDWPLVECTMEARPGGALRFVWANAEMGRMGMSGTFREVVVPERTVHTELFDEDWTGGEAVVTTIYADQGDRTLVASTVRYGSQQVRDMVRDTCIDKGWAPMYRRLHALMRERVGTGAEHAK